jgi:hypothetical protein
VKTVADTLDVARSNVVERQKRARPARGPQIRPGDVELTTDIRRLVDQRPTYGYRRIAALLKRERRSAGQDPVNAKRSTVSHLGDSGCLFEPAKFCQVRYGNRSRHG